MENKDYSIKYFYDSLPDWKRKIDSIPVRYFYRPISFAFSSICAKWNIQANDVSYISIFVALIGSALYLPTDYCCHLIGAFLLNLWLALDCTDGNLARCVKKQPYGEFADAISSYILTGFMCLAIGFASYGEKGIILKEGCPWIILIGAIASISDVMTRAVFHKFNQTRKELEAKGVLPVSEDKGRNTTKRGFLRALFEDQFGMGGFLPLFIFLATIFHALDILTVYLFIYYGAEMAATIFYTVSKAVKAAKEYEMK